MGDPSRRSVRTTSDTVRISWSNRTSYRLAEAGISTVGDLVRMSPKEVLEIRGIARKSLEEIEWELREMGLELGVEADRR